MVVIFHEFFIERTSRENKKLQSHKRFKPCRTKIIEGTQLGQVYLTVTTFMSSKHLIAIKWAT